MYICSPSQDLAIIALNGFVCGQNVILISIRITISSTICIVIIIIVIMIICITISITSVSISISSSSSSIIIIIIIIIVAGEVIRVQKLGGQAETAKPKEAPTTHKTPSAADIDSMYIIVLYAARYIIRLDHSVVYSIILYHSMLGSRGRHGDVQLHDAEDCLEPGEPEYNISVYIYIYIYIS